MKDSKTADQAPEDHTYDISTVCRLVGLTSANLRIWEKRYGAVTPTRSSSGRRQYSRRDLQRLTLLKTLTSLGHSIKSSAKLPFAELERRIEESARPDPGGGPVTSHACRICVIGGYVGTILDSENVMPERAVKVAEFPDLDSIEPSALPETVDLLIIECPALLVQEIPKIENLITGTKALRSIVIYTFTTSAVLESLENRVAQITPIRAPLSPGELKMLCETDVALTNRSADAALENAPLPGGEKEGIPDRQFSEQQLAKIAQISTSIKCECPHQLVSLLKSLNGFEIYSAECENENAADAEIHAYLHQSTAQARSIIEDALKVLIKFEGLNPEEA
ncbi:MAG: MerR family transcriptional regulator [Verrucomicrobiales bacterium]|nr:MerR family transcriptional regulator [Verrucomicrobiales bacterium]